MSFNRYYRPRSPARTNIGRRLGRRLPQQYIPQEESDEIFYYTPAAYSNSSDDIVLEHLREYNLQRMKGSPSSHHQQVRTINVYILTYIFTPQLPLPSIMHHKILYTIRSKPTTPDILIFIILSFYYFNILTLFYFIILTFHWKAIF